jgi:folate-binding protein YgfZ
VDVIAVPRLEREFVAVRGSDAEPYLQAMVSNDVEALSPGESCDALLLTPKARVIAPLTVWRRSADDFLLLTAPGLGERVRAALVRTRFAAKCEIELEEHASALVVGAEAPAGTVANRDYGLPAYEILDGDPPADARLADLDELERLRILARTPVWGREIDERILPAEAGLDVRAIDFAKGCYPGQEPIARQHYRGRVNRSLRVLEIDGGDLPVYDVVILWEGKAAGRVTSAVRDGQHVLALCYVRREVPDDAALEVDGRRASQREETQLDLATPARP